MNDRHEKDNVANGIILSLPDEKFTSSSLVTNENESENRKLSSRAFHFPYPIAYSIQLDLMRSIFKTIEEKKIGIFESPTGTGKSLSLICAACTWLQENNRRHELGKELVTDRGDDDDQEPDWVKEHETNKKLNLLQQHEEELQRKIDSARIRLENKRRDTARSVKRARIPQLSASTSHNLSDSDDDYLVEDNGFRSKAKLQPDDPNSFLSPEVRALMEKTGSYIKQDKGKQKKPFFAKQVHENHDDKDDDDEPQTLPKVIYVSRTHSQISQFINELKRIDFAKQKEVEITQVSSNNKKFVVRTISLGSRKQMCINKAVIELGQRQGIEAMNEKCLDLMKRKKGSTSKAGCEFLPSFDESGEIQMMDYRDNVLAYVGDMEDAVSMGKEMHICPYFGARGSAKQAHIVTLPYNLLLNATARNSLNIDLNGSIVIVDEAHNLIDTILATHTVVITATQVQRAIEQITEYLQRFSTRLKGTNEINLKKLLLALQSIQNFSDNAIKLSTNSLTTAEFMHKIGGNFDQINFMELDRWLRDTKVARKIAGYSDRKQRQEIGDQRELKSSGISALHNIESFLLSLTNSNFDGRIFFSSMSTSNGDTINSAQAKEQNWSIKYQLLNPAEVFGEIVQSARSVILAGGTMEPISDFSLQLFPSMKPDRITHFSCSHIIPPQNLMAAVICKSAKGSQLSFRYDARSNSTILEELTEILINYTNVIPDGIVVFLPSYGFLDSLKEYWKGSKQFTRLSTKKQVFYEPKNASDVESVLRDYSKAINDDLNTSQQIRKGAIMFAVVGAKLSEGINFSDRLARAVIMVGMPFANINSPELKERMDYMRMLQKQKQSQISSNDVDAGQELYINLCMKAVNQSIGRAIRHQNDFAALLFLDYRYSRKDTLKRLPNWIQNSTKVYESFGPSMAALGSFFRSKKQK